MKVAIIGGAPTSKDLAPYQTPDYQIWSCSPSNAGKLPRVDAWFELHALVDLRSKRWADWVDPYRQYLNTLTCPVFMQDENELVPNAVAFPRDELVERFKHGFFTSTIAWMLGKAINDGAQEIGIYGVDMSASSEFDFERPGCHYFIQLARHAGIRVIVPPQSDLDAMTPDYGFGDALPMVTRLKEHCHEMRGRVSGLVQRLADIESERAHLLAEKSHLEGAIEENVYVRRTWLAWSGPDR
jgi:hypothetical protein